MESSQTRRLRNPRIEEARENVKLKAEIARLSLEKKRLQLLKEVAELEQELEQAADQKEG